MRKIATAAALVLAVVVATGAAGCAGQGARPQAPPGRLTPVWSAAIGTYFVSDGVTARLFAFTDTALVLPAPGGGLTVRDPRTGRTARTIAPDPGWSFSDVAVIGGRVYAGMVPPSQNLIRFAAYSLRGGGGPAWRTDLAVTPFQEVGLRQALITSRGVVVQLGVAGMLRGLRLSDGKIAWRARLPAQCPNGDDTATPMAAVFLLECAARRVRLASVDPASGRVSWQRTVAAGRGDAPPFSLAATQAGDILAEAGTSTWILGPGGRLIATRRKPLTACPGGFCRIGAHAAVGVVALGDQANVTQGIDLATGKVRWQRKGGLIGVSSELLVDSAGTLFAVAGGSTVDAAAAGLLPEFVVAVQTATGRSTVIPLPMAGYASSPVVGTAADLLFVQGGGLTSPVITALRPGPAAAGGPVALGGVAAAGWPDACALLTPADLRFITAGYVSSPRRVTLPGVTWPKPVTCVYVGLHTADPAVILTIGWVAATARQADGLLASDLTFLASSYQPARRIPGGYLVYDGALNGAADRALVAAGRVVVLITVPGHPGDARRLAPIVAARLRATGG